MTARVALVTGAARGIGRAVAERLAADGFDVAVVDRETGACEPTVRAIVSTGRRAVAVVGDVSDETDAARIVAEADSSLGPPTVLVNNAGVMREGIAHRTTLADWRAPLDVNLTGTFLMSRAVVSPMRAAEFGRIINLSSIGARGIVGLAAYGASKAGIEALTRTMALELGRHGITVNAIAPGFIVTDMNRELAQRAGRTLEQMEQEMLEGIPVGRAGTPADVAQVASFFADERSGFVSGQVLVAAGGPAAG